MLSLSLSLSHPASCFLPRVGISCFKQALSFLLYVCTPRWNLLRQRWSVSGDGQIEFLTLPLRDIVWFLFWTYIYMFWLWDISPVVAFARFWLAATWGNVLPPCSVCRGHTPSVPDAPDFLEKHWTAFHEAGLLVVIHQTKCIDTYHVLGMFLDAGDKPLNRKTKISVRKSNGDNQQINE